MSNEAVLIKEMIKTWFGGDQSDDAADMARVLAVVREHDRKKRDDDMRLLGHMTGSCDNMSAEQTGIFGVARAAEARRVPVQIVNMTQPNDGPDTIIALASDGSLHRGQYAGGAFRWIEQLSPLPQPGDGA